MEKENIKNKRVVIIGAGPAGLACAYKLLQSTGFEVVILEADNQIGGLSKTINNNGSRFDIGPHRFFSKSQEVLSLWQEIMPLTDEISGGDKVFLTKKRQTRIYYNNKFFDYPIRLNLKNLKKFRFTHLFKSGIDYMWVRISPIKPETSLEDFFINRFGRTLYKTFFKSYTEKVWGLSCQEISSDWGSQRVKALSISRVLFDSLKKLFIRSHSSKETSLIEQFYYPSLGAGQMYEILADKVIARGGSILYLSQAIKVETENTDIKSIHFKHKDKVQVLDLDYLVSSAPVKDLVKMIDVSTENLLAISQNLLYRDFIIVALSYRKESADILNMKGDELSDQWLYIHDQKSPIGRLDIFNNFSSKMLKNDAEVLIGAEYFCQENDSLWQKSDEELIKLSVDELERMYIFTSEKFIQGKVHRQIKAYPAYFGSYKDFPQLKKYLNSFTNLYCIGRNGQHRYNNMDHSVLCGLRAADHIIDPGKSKEDIWNINTEKEYHEKKKI
jgi:protoporphyrinogen oxidase